MNTVRILCSVLLLFAVSGTSLVTADTYLVTALTGGTLIEVDQDGNQSIVATGLGRPLGVVGDQSGNLYLRDLDADQILKIDKSGAVTTFTTQTPADSSIVDMALSARGELFALTHYYAGPLITSEIYRLVENGPPEFLASTETVAAPGQTARGFTFGRGGHLYLAMQGGNAPVQILRVKRNGDVDIWFDPGFPAFDVPGGVNFTDIRFGCKNRVFILGRIREEPVDPDNQWMIFMIEQNVISQFVPVGNLPNGSLQMDMDSENNIVVSGGGFGGGQGDGFIQLIDPEGNVTELTTFPGMSAIFDIEVGDGRVTSLEFGTDSISCCPHPGSVALDFVRGDLMALVGSAGDFGTSTTECMADDLEDPTLTYSSTPGPGEAEWFLTRYVSEDGGESYDSGQPSQAEPRDVEIAVSGGDCLP
ncbi:MAG: hypothetical protein GY716_08330 [bacterium]|nr:hypothetical protein [bacterium]